MSAEAVMDRRICTAPDGAGPITGYRTYGCRCYTCSAASSAYERDRLRAIKLGNWQPLIDATPVIKHLDGLRRAGLGHVRVARAAKLEPGLVLRYMSDASRPLPKRIRPTAADALLQVTVDAALYAGNRVPSVGTVRRIQALAALGWSITQQAELLGIRRSDCSNMLTREQVSAQRAKQVTALYERLSGTPGPSSSARIRAEAKGWLPPLAWDDEDLDNPLGRPAKTGRQAQMCSRGHGFAANNIRIHPTNGRRICITCESGKHKQTTTERAAA